MNDTILRPECETDLAQIIASYKCVLAVGNRSKPALSNHSGATLVSLASLSGVVEYEPSEFTFTAKAGTRIDEITTVLAARNQYLPFDPMLAVSGATLGGTIASGLSGPGRFRFGGVRDFLLGVDFFSGEGKPIRAGGKVVKNAAGFDIPKLLVGSLGRLGAMTSMTFKVFPRPIVTKTVSVVCQSHEQAMQRTAEAGASRWELDAIDYRCEDRAMYLRLAGPDEVNQAIAAEIRGRWGDDVADCPSPDEFWRGVTEATWVAGAPYIVKVPITAKSFLELEPLVAGLTNARAHLSAAANVMWMALDDAASIDRLDEILTTRGDRGLIIRGDHRKCWIGATNASNMTAAIKHAMDPGGRFPQFA